MTLNEKASFGVSLVAFGISLFLLFMYLVTPTPLAPEPLPVKRANYGVEIDCSGTPHEIRRGKSLMISGLKGDDIHTVTLHAGDLKRDIDTTNKLCSVDVVELDQ